MIVFFSVHKFTRSHVVVVDDKEFKDPRHDKPQYHFVHSKVYNNSSLLIELKVSAPLIPNPTTGHNPEPFPLTHSKNPVLPP
jgi:hypothetical protein